MSGAPAPGGAAVGEPEDGPSRDRGREPRGGLAADILDVRDGACFVLDRAWRLVYATRSLCELAGRPHDERPGKPSRPSCRGSSDGADAARCFCLELPVQGG